MVVTRVSGQLAQLEGHLRGRHLCLASRCAPCAGRYAPCGADVAGATGAAIRRRLGTLPELSDRCPSMTRPAG